MVLKRVPRMGASTIPGTPPSGVAEARLLMATVAAGRMAVVIMAFLPIRRKNLSGPVCGVGWGGRRIRGGWVGRSPDRPVQHRVNAG